MSSIEKFDNYLKKIPPAQKYFLYLLPALLAGAIYYLNILPLQEEEWDSTNQRISQLQNDIKRKSPRRLRNRLKKSEQELLALKSKIQESQDDLNYLYARLSNLEVSEFDNRKWTLTLDKILKKSLDLSIEIKHIKNSDSQIDPKKSQDIIPKKYVEIVGSGAYKDLLSYLHFIENTQFLIAIKNIQFVNNKESQKIDFTINFTIYGVTL